MFIKVPIFEFSRSFALTLILLAQAQIHAWEMLTFRRTGYSLPVTLDDGTALAKARLSNGVRTRLDLKYVR